MIIIFRLFLLCCTLCVSTLSFANCNPSHFEGSCYLEAKIKPQRAEAILCGNSTVYVNKSQKKIIAHYQYLGKKMVLKKHNGGFITAFCEV